ncbi:MAG: hypothetical protein H6668_16925 [Ardenticatenaceae bacterium]|nr:hypothetical protein [Ardenticatenaceae bacterium]
MQLNPRRAAAGQSVPPARAGYSAAGRAWPLVAPSPLPYTPTSQRPEMLDEAGMGK